MVLSLGCSPKKETRESQVGFQLKELEHSSSSLSIRVSELEAWDTIVGELNDKFPLERRGDTYRLYGYLYVAQKAFADASFLLTGAYSGTLDPICLQVLRLFYPSYQNKELKSDPFSEELAALVIEPLEKRFHEEEQGMKPTQLSNEKNRWNGKPSTNRLIPSFKPWSLTHASEFRAPKPPAPEDRKWREQLEQTKQKSSAATDLQKRRSLFWADMITRKSPDWKIFASEYMKGHESSLEQWLEVRSSLAKALVDAMIAVYYDKFDYGVQRPFMLDADLKTYIPTPNHPSYPSAHSTISGAAATILSYYFPENQKEWEHLMSEASQSRLWAGIHFPIDLEVGEAQGKQIGKAVLFR